MVKEERTRSTRGTAGAPIEGVQTWSIPAGGGAVFETTFEAGASGEGLYPFVTHAFADARLLSP